jgi:hypothetical protein
MMQKLHLQSAVLTRHVTKLALLAGLALPAASAQAATVWATHATQKVRPGDAPGNAQSLHVSAARNEFEAFQVVVHDSASGVQATASDFVGPGTIPASAVTLYREALYNATNKSGPDGAVGMWPDALVPDVDTYKHEKRNAFPFDVPSGENRAIWAEVLVPADAVPGDYTGKINVTGNGLPTGGVDVPVTLTVHRFTLPSTPSLHTAFGMYWAGPCQGHFGGYANCGGDPGVEAIRDLYIRSALDHRISIENAVYYGPSNGDWTHFDQVYGPVLDGTASTRLAGAKLTSLRYVANRTAALASSWANHFKQKGWFDRLFDYTCDEPPQTCTWSDINARSAIMKQADPNFRTLVTTTLAKATANGVASSINLLVPLVNEIEPKSGVNTRPGYDGFTGHAGDEVWWYQSCMSHGCGGAFGSAAGSVGSTDPEWGGWPTYAIDSTAVRSRAQEWLSFKDRVSTELYYETTMHLDTAWQNSYDFGGNGDGTLFYPGKPDIIGGTSHIPVESIRLKLIREGIEDFEYLKMLSDLGEGTFAMQQAEQLFPMAGSVGSVSPEALYAAREAIAQHLDAHFPAPAGGTTATSATSATSTTATSATSATSTTAAASTSGTTTGGAAASTTTGGAASTTTGGAASTTTGDAAASTTSSGAAASTTTGGAAGNTSTATASTTTGGPTGSGGASGSTGHGGSTGGPSSPWSNAPTLPANAPRINPLKPKLFGGCGASGDGASLAALAGGLGLFVARRRRR